MTQGWVYRGSLHIHKTNGQNFSDPLKTSSMKMPQTLFAKPVPSKYMIPGSVNVGFICIYLCVEWQKNDPILLAVTTDVRIYQLTTF